MRNFRFPTRITLSLVALGCGLLLGACSEGNETPASKEVGKVDKTTAAPALSAVAQVGKKLFFDKALSASGAMSCASCHDPAHAYGPPNALAVQLGGAHLDKPGLRAVPSLRYKLVTPAYSNELFDPDGTEPPGPGGGFSWDGRANTLAEQAAQPLLSDFEMGNISREAVVEKVRAASYAPLFLEVFGSRAFEDGVKAFAGITQALEAFQKEDPDFRPYSSKFDAYVMRGKGTLTVPEQRGKAVFYDPRRGNCASCHIPDLNQFTDQMYAAIGVPRNPAILANAADKFYDLGLCGPLREDMKPERSLCGMFKTPTLRNVATRSVFFHNGVMTSLEQVIRFYNTRDTNPEIWYPTKGGKPQTKPSSDFPTYGLITTQYAGGRVQKFNDLPTAYLENIDPQMPLDGRAAASKPPMSEQDIADLICFLKTLTDGFDEAADKKQPASGACVN
ncbi:cytochrome-c peroxidase [Comamonas thiooxydans]|uniref:cytochrome-c peroxidase n=1 Tax=Comamonas thiooxydans TaxID=363952 RepID=UPI0001BB0D95|nr:cytochrome c peroxidase [Comamonas thiooxydans]ACY31261.1 Di-heme cytochrome c peroxidase [Comamonas thiooxydans]MDO1473101.1 cytochrome-c peroxidase [Comamonas thiooxydans]